MKSKVVGLLKEDEYGLGCVSQPTEIPYFDNLKLPIMFTEAEDRTYLEASDAALQRFIQLNANNRKEHSALLYPYYEAVLSYEYIEPFDLKSSEDIWNFVHPSEITIGFGDNNVSSCYVVVSCECDWEEEHGLQLVFTNGETLTRVGGYDGHYTD